MNEEARVTVPRRTRSEIRQVVAQFAESGLNQSEFCRRHGLCMGTLSRHLRRLRKCSSSVRTRGTVERLMLHGHILQKYILFRERYGQPKRDADCDAQDCDRKCPFFHYCSYGLLHTRLNERSQRSEEAGGWLQPMHCLVVQGWELVALPIEMADA